MITSYRLTVKTTGPVAFSRNLAKLPFQNNGVIQLRRVAFLILILLGVLCPVLGAKTIDLDSATIADINAAFKSGTLTAEKLVQLCLARIEAYDREGPALHAVMTINPKAVEIARALDAERKAKGPRSPLHGIPVVLKDNYNTFDMPTTGGSVLLEGSIPPDDAFVVKKLRAAGAIIVAKVNMSEFASAGAYSSLGGQTRNPHDPARSPSGGSVPFHRPWPSPAASDPLPRSTARTPPSQAEQGRVLAAATRGASDSEVRGGRQRDAGRADRAPDRSGRIGTDRHGDQDAARALSRLDQRNSSTYDLSS